MFMDSKLNRSYTVQKNYTYIATYSTLILLKQFTVVCVVFSEVVVYARTKIRKDWGGLGILHEYSTCSKHTYVRITPATPGGLTFHIKALTWFTSGFYGKTLPYSLTKL
jgi:hypothetical protein